MSTTQAANINVLRIEASGRHAGSTTRELGDRLTDALARRHGALTVTRRETVGIGHVDEAWITANFTDPADRNDAQKAALAQSDELVAELKATDVLVIGAPLYNFGVPAALKAWIDMVARARLTFRYTDNGPVGLLEGKKAYVIVASGGVPVDSPVDFATPYLRHALAFLGITDVEVIAADRLMQDAEASRAAAEARIAEIGRESETSRAA